MINTIDRMINLNHWMIDDEYVKKHHNPMIVTAAEAVAQLQRGLTAGAAAAATGHERRREPCPVGARNHGIFGFDPLVNEHKHGTSPCLMSKSTILQWQSSSLQTVSLPEGKHQKCWVCCG